MAEETDFENGRNSNFEGVVTLTLTFDPAIRHIVLQQSSTSTYIPTFIQIEETFCGRTDVWTYGRTDIFPLYTIRSTFGSRPNNKQIHKAPCMPTEGCRGAGEVLVRRFGEAIKQECLKMSFKTMFRIAQHECFCMQTVPNDRCGIGE